MNKISLMLFCLFFISCEEKIAINDLKNSNNAVQKILSKEEEASPVLLIVKNENCDLCKKYTQYITDNPDYLETKLPNDTKVSIAYVNDFESENMWLYHIFKTYSFPMTFFIDDEKNIKAVFNGADLYRFNSFLGSLAGINNQKRPKQLLEYNLSNINLYIEGYQYILNGKTIPDQLFGKIIRQNAIDKSFIGILIEGYYYKQKHIYPDRVKTIHDFLSKLIIGSKGYFNSQKKYVNDLIV